MGCNVVGTAEKVEVDKIFLRELRPVSLFKIARNMYITGLR